MRDNTIVLVLSDNGASQEGGPLGFVNAMGPFNFRPEPMAEKLRAHRRHRRPRDPLEFPAWLGDGVQHAAAALQAEHPWRRHPRSPGHVLAEADRGARRAAPPVRPCLRPDADAARTVGIEPPAEIGGCPADADRGRELCRARSTSRRHRQNRRRNISRCSAIAASGTRAGRRSPFIRRARRSRTTNGSCFISTRIFPRSMISPAASRERLADMIELWWQRGREAQGAAARRPLWRTLRRERRALPRRAQRIHLSCRHGTRADRRRPRRAQPQLHRSRPMSRSTNAGAEGVLIAHGDATSGYSLYVQGRPSGARPEYRRQPCRS